MSTLSRAVIIAIVLSAWVPLQAQSVRELSLDDALALASGHSEEVAIAQAGVDRASANVDRAESQRRPQLSFSAAYQRALISQFEGFGGGGDAPSTPPECAEPYTPDPDLPLEERVARLEARVGCPSASPFGGIDFSQLGFGAKNTYNLGLAGSWLFYSGGRVEAIVKASESLRDIARKNLTSTEAQLQLDVTQAYFDAQLSDELVEISERSLETTDEVVRLTELRVRAGTQAEFDLLQAQVSRDNQRPPLIRRRSQRDLAYDRLRMLIELPDGELLRLTTPVTAPPPAVTPAIDPLTRIPVVQAQRRVEAAKHGVRSARAQRRPSIAANSQYGLVAYSDAVPSFGDFRDNLNVGVGVQMPILDGGRIGAEVASARADVAEAEASLQQVIEYSRLDTTMALAELRAARATLESTEGIVDQAGRAYSIAQLRYREGVSTQIEVQNSRLLLEQARLNRAQAARDVWVEQTRVELLHLLPFTSLSAGAPSGRPAVSLAPAGAMGSSSMFGPVSGSIGGGMPQAPQQQGPITP